jgi:hypothetical protein
VLSNTRGRGGTHRGTTLRLTEDAHERLGDCP